MKITVALVGNPNSGKTTLFNALTGANQVVGNWPGVTVEKKEGKVKFKEHELNIVDLPGVYSLSPYSSEEVITRDYILKENPDVVIDILDATNIERNLYLSTQVMELGRPVVIAMNMMDEVEKIGDKIDCDAMTKAMGIPVIPITARSGKNKEALLAAVCNQAKDPISVELDDMYDDFTHKIHHEIDDLIQKNALKANLPLHWSSIKLLENDTLIEKTLALSADQQKMLNGIIKRYEASTTLGDRETLMADSRYNYVERIVSQCVVKHRTQHAMTTSDKIDRIITNKWLSFPIFIAIMGFIFYISFGPVGTFLQEALDYFISGSLTNWINAGLSAVSSPEWLHSLVTNGIIAGVGGVLSFLPHVALLFLFMSLLEGSGYMARVAFIMDRAMRPLGLSGRSIIPMIMGFGCTVPAYMAARTMDTEKDRRLTMMILPFMSCSARAPIYALFAGVFFKEHQGLVVLSLYLLGIVIGILTAIIFKSTVFKGEAPPFVMELPPYRVPAPRNTALQIWERIRGFIVRAGTLIFGISIVLWFMQTYNFSFQQVEASKSMLGTIGGAIAPIFRPLGFGNWQASISLLTGLGAKEAVVGSMEIFYGFSAQATDISAYQALSATFTPLAAYSFMAFTLLYVPCVAAIAALKKEMNSTKWTLISLGWSTLVAYVVSLLIFQIGSLFI